MGAIRFTQYLLALTSVISTASSAAAPARRSAASGWPSQVAASVHDPSWPEFIEETKRWSTYPSPTFDSVFIPTSPEELSIGLQYLSSTNKTWLAKSGGHGYSATLQTIQNATMINMQNFNYSTMQPDLTVKVGSGATFQDMTVPVANAGREIRATGAMLGGGVGRLQGKHGLTSDAVRAVRMVLYNGTIVEASEKVNPDLFWGIRGAGQNFGIVFETTYQTFNQSNGGIQYNADMTFTGEHLDSVIDAINSLYPLDPSLALVILYSTNATTLEPSVAINLVYAGPESEGKQFTAKFSNFSTTLQESMIPWVDLAYKSAGGAVAAKCTKGLSHNMHDSVTESVNKTVFHQLFDSYGSFIAAHPALVNSTVLLEIFGQQGIDALPQNYSAFPHRGRLNTLIAIEMAYIDNSVASIADEWARGWRGTLSSPEVAGYDRMVQYQNYAHGDEPLSALYGYEQWRHERLTRLKRTYDPMGQFSGYHAVPETLDGWN
ncbi:hypothetical protein AbraIFM66951_007557 [Aspergillus brasiliensis]|uniref:FAD-binding PCMH-type domain-containing protein n=1 Tax=Aspergillus brasiliensis TaxID=319629 RepID=A0A9W5YTJ4_9EURO|nr:hypothetical protein AbraCBS73388_009940 [Aspergillus brasiliensis]GKZ41003.1 hypothetical protein AbraIFM66951_007557 [Aspergillus brasiliensis]